MVSAASCAKAVQLPQSHVYARAPRGAADPIVAPGGTWCYNSQEQICEAADWDPGSEPS